MKFQSVSTSVRRASNKLGHWVIEYAIFLHGLAQQCRLCRKQNLAQVRLGDEDDVWTLNTHIAQKKHAIPHSMMKNPKILECCNNTHQGAPHTTKQTCACALNLGDITCALLRLYVQHWVLLSDVWGGQWSNVDKHWPHSQVAYSALLWHQHHGSDEATWVPASTAQHGRSRTISSTWVWSR